MAALINEAAEGGPGAVDEAEVRHWLASPEDLAFAAVENDDGAILAYADLAVPREATDRAWLDVRIPRRTLGDATLDAVLHWTEERAGERGSTLLRASVAGTSPIGEMLSGRGFRPIRHSLEMCIDLDEPPETPRWPEGIAVRTLRGGEEGAVYEVAQESFQDHWEYVRDPYEQWAHFMLGAEDFDPSLWFLALDAEEIAGVSLCRASRPGRPGVGWVRVLGVRRPWRRRGLGLALLLHSFGELWRRGARAVGLGVDAENLTGAVRLYERAGMWVEHRYDIYERRLP